jgi:glycosyltransferase involved in cell wall biosynthesis
MILLADNDGPHLETVVADWVAFFNGLGRDYEIILVDDGSTDQTVRLTTPLKDRHGHLKVIRHGARQGEGAALKSGLGVARYPLLFYTVCDPNYRSADFKRLLAEIDKVHLISGYRGGHPVPTFVRFFGSLLSFASRVLLGTVLTPLPGWLGWKRHLGRLMVRIVFGVRNQDVACPFRLIRREIFARMPVQSKGGFAHAEILAKANFLGCVLGEEITLGDRQRPIPLDARRTDSIGQMLRQSFRVFQNPKFGPPLPETKANAARTNLDEAVAPRL